MTSIRDQVAELTRKLEDVMTPVSLRYNALSPVERLTLAGLSGVIVVVLTIVLIWTPLYEWKENKLRSLLSYGGLVSWIQSEAPKVRQQGGNARLPAGQSLQAVLVKDAQRAKVTLQRYEPKGENELRVWINEVDFEVLIGWLDNLQRRYGVSVTDVAIEHKPTSPGVVKATIVFSG
ncbi:MAG: type II secretion system protein M [Gammaproteobacteria bacterium]